MRFEEFDPDNKVGQQYAALKKQKKLASVVVILLILGLFLFANTAVVTSETEYSVIMNMGAILRTVETAGLSWKAPFVQSVRKVPKTIQYYDMPVSSITTRDKQLLDMDLFTAYRIIDPKLYIQTLNGSQDAAESRIGNLAYSVSKTKASLLSQADLIQGRNDLAKSFIEDMSAELVSYGLKLEMIETKKIDPLKANLPSIYERMRSERGRIVAQYQAEGEGEARKIRSTADQEVSIVLSEARRDADKLKADGEAEYMRVLSSVYNDPEKAEFYLFIRQLDALELALQNTETTLVLNQNSPLAQLFYGD